MPEQSRLEQMIRQHWQAHLPEMWAQLQAAGQLETAILHATEQTGDLLHELLTVQRMDYQSAWEMATREWAFLPSEDRPELQS